MAYYVFMAGISFFSIKESTVADVTYQRLLWVNKSSFASMPSALCRRLQVY